MAVTVYIPTPFRRATGNRDRVAVSPDDVGSLLDSLEPSYTALRGLVHNQQGEVHHHVNIFVNSEGIDALQGLKPPLRDGDEGTIIPPPAGVGARSAATQSAYACTH